MVGKALYVSERQRSAVNDVQEVNVESASDRPLIDVPFNDLTYRPTERGNVGRIFCNGRRLYGCDDVREAGEPELGPYRRRGDLTQTTTTGRQGKR